MSETVRIEPVKVHGDARGMVFEPIGLDLLPGQQNVHVAVSEPGCVRGNHYHRNAREALVVAGPSLVRLRENGAVREVSVPAGEVFRFIVPPGVSHAVQNSGPKASLLVAFSTQPHDPANPDTVADKLF